MADTLFFVGKRACTAQGHPLTCVWLPPTPHRSSNEVRYHARAPFFVGFAHLHNPKFGSEVSHPRTSSDGFREPSTRPGPKPTSDAMFHGAGLAWATGSFSTSRPRCVNRCEVGVRRSTAAAHSRCSTCPTRRGALWRRLPLPWAMWEAPEGTSPGCRRSTDAASLNDKKHKCQTCCPALTLRGSHATFPRFVLPFAALPEGRHLVSWRCPELIA